MTFDEWLKVHRSGNQIDGATLELMRTAFEAGTDSLRDKFAMAALQGMLADSNLDGTIGVFVEWAYKYADAMLKERLK